MCHDSGSSGEQPFAIADQAFQRLHDEYDGRQDGRVVALRCGFIAGTEQVVDADGVIDQVGSQDQPSTAGAQIVGQFQTAAAVEHGHEPFGEFDELTDLGGRRLALQKTDVRVLAGEFAELVGGEAAAHVGGRILDGDRNAAASATRPKKRMYSAAA